MNSRPSQPAETQGHSLNTRTASVIGSLKPQGSGRPKGKERVVLHSLTQTQGHSLNTRTASVIGSLKPQGNAGPNGKARILQAGCMHWYLSSF